MAARRGSAPAVDPDIAQTVARSKRAIVRAERRQTEARKVAKATAEELRRLESAARSGRRGAARPSVRELSIARKAAEDAEKALGRVTADLARLKKCLRTFERERREKAKAAGAKRAFEGRVRRKEAYRHRRVHEHVLGLEYNAERPPELQEQPPPLPGPRKYPPAELQLVSLWVCEWMRRSLRASANELRGAALVYRFPETLEVDGRLIFRKPQDEELGPFLAGVSDALRATFHDVDFEGMPKDLKTQTETLYHHELWVQGVVVVHVNEQNNKSPFDSSRVLPGGIIEGEMRTNWTRSVQPAAALARVINWIGNGADEYEDGTIRPNTERGIYVASQEAFERRGQEVDYDHYEIRLHWSIEQRRPDRQKATSDEDTCEAADDPGKD